MTATQPDFDQRLATVKRKVAKHDEDNRLYSEMITDTNIRVRGIESQMVKLDGRMVRLDGRMDRLDGGMLRIDCRMLRIEDQMLQTDGRLVRIEDQMVQTDGRLVRIEDSLSLIAQALGVELPAAKPLDD